MGLLFYFFVLFVLPVETKTRQKGRPFPRPAQHYNTLQHSATHYNTLQHTATHYNTLHHTATHGNTMQHTATNCDTLQLCTLPRLAHRRGVTPHTSALFMVHFAKIDSARTNTLQHTTPHYTTLHHTATHCNTVIETWGQGGGSHCRERSCSVCVSSIAASTFCLPLFIYIVCMMYACLCVLYLCTCECQVNINTIGDAVERAHATVIPLNRNRMYVVYVCMYVFVCICVLYLYTCIYMYM